MEPGVGKGGLVASDIGRGRLPVPGVRPAKFLKLLVTASGAAGAVGVTGAGGVAATAVGAEERPTGANPGISL